MDIPRDRNGSFDPVLIAKYQRRFPEFDTKIISMYARGMVAKAQAEGVQNTMGTVDQPVPLEAKNRGVAVATGLLPDKDAVYLSEKHDVELGNTYKATYAVPEQTDPELGFYSMTAYGEDQYLKTDQGSTISNTDLKLNPDGMSFDIYYVPESEFGKGGHPNELIIPTAPFWTNFRIYLPGESVLNGSYKSPKLEPVE